MKCRSRPPVLFPALAAASLVLAVASARAGLVAYYSFDDDNAADLSGNGNNGTVGGSVTFSDDSPFMTGKAMETLAQGAAYVVTVPTSPSLEAISNQLSMSFWMKAGTAGQANWIRIFQHGTEASGDRTWLIDRYSNTADTNMRVDTTAQFNQNIAVNGTVVFDNQWHHLVYTLNSGTWEEYLDGVRASGAYNHGDGIFNTRDLYIAGRNGAGQYIGLLDDVAVWDTRLTEGEARSLYTVRTRLDLDYSHDEMVALFNVFDTVTPAEIAGVTWTRQEGLTGHGNGDAWITNGLYCVQLEAGGAGVVSPVPVPPTLLILAVGLLGFGAWSRRCR